MDESAKTCLLTGATRGLGHALAQRFWEGGFSLCLVARRQADLEAAAAALPARSGQEVVCLACDLADPAAADGLMARAAERLSRLDVLLNNAAMQGPIGPAWENDFAAWRQTVQVNLLAPVSLCRAAVPFMAKTGGGAIINLSGGGATGPRANFTAYASAKAALVRFSETLADEARGLGIRVNCIAPGAMKTAMLGEVVKTGAAAAGEREYAIAAKVCAEGGAPMDRVAELALFLATEAGSGITGKLVSAVWDNWEQWPGHLEELLKSDVYTLRRIAGRDRGFTWGDK
jgi:3-oxoacyl-[acyl-carrier protein] reductase